MRGKSPKRYPRTARVNEVLREVVADELERIDDERLGITTVTGVGTSSSDCTWPHSSNSRCCTSTGPG